MDYFREVKPWKIENEPVEVVVNNDHLGLIVSGEREEEKNVDERIKKGRKSLFSLLGPAFSQKCLLSPVEKMHLFQIFTCPITRCGLSALALRSSQLESVDLFERKSLRSFLSLSSRSTIASLYFLFSDVPMSSKIHRDVFSIFYSIWCNPQSKLFEIFRYLWNEAPANSRTWTVHIKNLSAQYQIPDLNKLLDTQPWKKETFKEFIITKIVAYKEAELRDEATRNSKMKFLNVSTLSLRGKPHPAIRGAGTTVQGTRRSTVL